MDLIKLVIRGKRWYATIKEGNITQTRPTKYPASMTKEQVLDIIRDESPEVNINFRGD